MRCLEAIFKPDGVSFWCLSSLCITLFLTKLLELLQQIQVKTPWPWLFGWKLPVFLRHMSWKQIQPWSARGFGRQQAITKKIRLLKLVRLANSHHPTPFINTGHLYDKLIFSIATPLGIQQGIRRNFPERSPQFASQKFANRPSSGQSSNDSFLDSEWTKKGSSLQCPWNLPSGELTYHTFGKGKSSSKLTFQGIC